MANHLKMAKIDTILTLHCRGWSNRRIGRELGIDRETVARHVRAGEGGSNATKAPTGSGHPGHPNAARAPTGSAAAITVETPDDRSGAGPPALPEADGSDRDGVSDCASYRDLILAKLDLGLSATRIHQDLVSDDAERAPSYYSVRRFVRRLQAARGEGDLPFRRLECGPGAEGQVDFGKAAPVVRPDGRRRRPHVLRVVLSHSRKGYSEAVYRQTTENFIRCLENAFWHFGGVPRTLVLDNLRAAVTKADWFDPEINPKVQSFCEHYGIVPLPTKPRMPRHKGKIERGIDYVQSNGLKGHVFDSLEAQNRHLLHWETYVADKRIHGTTRQQVGKVFEEAERPALLPLPTERFAFFHEAERSVHRDGHVEVAKAYYSVPPEYLSHRVWVRWDGHVVRIFDGRMAQIAIHAQREPGRFSTQGRHISVRKISGVERGAADLLEQTRLIGSQTHCWAQAMIEVRGIPGVRVLLGLLHLTRRHSAEHLEEACRIAAAHGAYRLRAIRELLKRGSQQTAEQEQFEFIQEHPIIRSLDEYAQLVHTAFLKEYNS